MGISVGSIRPSMVIIYDGKPYTVLECNHVKLARGPAFCKVKLKDLKSSQILECTVRDSDNVMEVEIEERKLQYQYNDASSYHFMDLETYEELICNKSAIEDKAEWLKENMEITGLFYKNEFVNLKMPVTVVYKIVETEPGFKGDSVKSGTKPAKLETGAIVQVPLFISVGDLVKIDIQDRQYLSRV
ncbi:MAG: elongation factor P [Candidatus Omnitrophota bacterium]